MTAAPPDFCPSFDHVAVVDWSAASGPSPARPSENAVWIGFHGADGASEHYFRTRQTAEAALRTAIARPGRWLLGFDFPLGYPRGFAARLTGRADPRAIHGWLATHIIDGPDNRNNRFQIAAQINRSLGAPLFWGRPDSLALPDLPPRHADGAARIGLAEKRTVEQAVPRAQSVWKLYTTGSVGSQVLMGLPMIARLSAQADVGLWPFTPDARVMLAEIYPSLLGGLVARQCGIRDAAQVRLLSRALWRMSQAGQLSPLLAAPAIAREEGWILGAGHADLLQAAAA